MTETTNELALQQEHSRRALAEQQELARLRDIERGHLRTSLQEAEDAVNSTKPIIEVSAVQATQLDPSYPTVTETALVSTGALEEPLPPTPRVPEPASQGPALLFPEEEKGIEQFSPPAKRPATQSPSPVSSPTDGHAYPPMHHGPTGSQSRPSSAGNQIKRGRDPTQTRAAAAAAEPPEPSPAARFIRDRLVHSQADSPLQDRSTSVKKAKPSDSVIEEGNPVAQDLSEQFESLADIRVAPPVFPQ